MCRSFVILFVVTINLFTFLDSYKITNDEGPRRNIDASDQQDSDIEGVNYSNEERSSGQSSGRVVIGKWRNNGEAFEPKWRDGDSVPLAPFSTMSFNSGWKRKGPDSREDYQIEPDTFYGENIRKNGDFQSGESHTVNKNENEYYNGLKLDQETEKSVGFKNGNREREDKAIENSTERRNGSGVKYRETLPIYPKEYELFENESHDDPRPRKRRPPQNYEFQTINERKSEAEKGDEAINRTRNRENVELKTFLKTQGADLSLSEILQQKNLTLADILKGKPNAIKILKSNDGEPDVRMSTGVTESTEKITPNFSTSGYVRWSPSRNKNTVRKLEGEENESSTVLVESTTLGTIRIDDKRIDKTVDKIGSSILQEFVRHNETSWPDKFDLRNNPSSHSKEDNKSEDLKREFLKPLEENRESLVTEATSNERDASLSSNGRFKPVNNEDDEIMEFSDYPLKMTKFIPPVIYENKRRNIPHSAIRAGDPLDDHDSKLSIENILSSDKKEAETAETEADVKSIDVTNPEKIEGFEKMRNETEFARRKNVAKLETLKNDSTTKEDSKESEESNSETNDKNLTLNKKFHEVVIPKIDPQSRAEILELFSSGSSAERLERLLASRNMTIEELIALRQRGSSQVHFAEVFKTKELKTSTTLPEVVKTEEILSERKKNQTKFVNVENSVNSTQNVRKETFGKYLSTNVFDNLSWSKNVRPNFSSVDKTDRNFDTSAINLENIKEGESNTDSMILSEKLPAVNNIQRDSEGSSYYTSIETVKVRVVNDEVDKIPSIFDDKKSYVIGGSLSEIGRVEEIIKNDLKSLKKDYEYSDKKSRSNDNKVKPSIIASGGILGVTIVVFLAIFIACRIRQKKKFTYKNSFAKAVFHNPVMTPRKLSNTSSINTIMVDVVATSTAKRSQQNHDPYQSDDFDIEKSDIDNDSLDANDSWDTIPDFMK